MGQFSKHVTLLSPIQTKKVDDRENNAYFGHAQLLKVK